MILPSRNNCFITGFLEMLWHNWLSLTFKASGRQECDVEVETRLKLTMRGVVSLRCGSWSWRCCFSERIEEERWHHNLFRWRSHLSLSAVVRHAPLSSLIISHPGWSWKLGGFLQSDLNQRKLHNIAYSKHTPCGFSTRQTLAEASFVRLRCSFRNVDSCYLEIFC